LIYETKDGAIAIGLSKSLARIFDGKTISQFPLNMIDFSKRYNLDLSSVYTVGICKEPGKAKERTKQAKKEDL
jgi:hypothetical protein